MGEGLAPALQHARGQSSCGGRRTTSYISHRADRIRCSAAVGDIHGDLAKAITLFKLAGVVEEVDRRLIWIGGDTTVVQLGDVLDRGAQEIGVYSVTISGCASQTICDMVFCAASVSPFSFEVHCIT